MFENFLALCITPFVKAFLRAVFLAFILPASCICIYGYALVPGVIGFFIHYERREGKFPILGSGALDQTSISEFIFYGTALFAVVVLFTFLIRAFGRSSSRIMIALHVVPALFASFAGLAFLGVSLPLLAAYIDAMGITSYRIAGLFYCAAFIVGQIWLIKSLILNEGLALQGNSKKPTN